MGAVLAFLVLGSGISNKRLWRLCARSTIVGMVVGLPFLLGFRGGSSTVGIIRQRQYETYTSLLELAERRWTAIGAITEHTDQYVEAGHIQSEMLDHLDRHLWSRPGGTGSSDPVGAERMCSTRAECTRSAENEGPGASPANWVPIPERTTHRFTTQEGIDAY